MTVSVAIASGFGSAVEFVEAFTTALAVGVARKRCRSAQAVLLGLVALTAMVAVLGVAPLHWVPLGPVRTAATGLPAASDWILFLPVCGVLVWDLSRQLQRRQVAPAAGGKGI